MSHTVKLASHAEQFDFAIRRQKRKTMALHVLTDASVEVRAPQWVSTKVIVDFVNNRSGWVATQRKQRLEKLARLPSFSDGEGHYFLGSLYRISVKQGKKSSATMIDDRLLLTVIDTESESQVEKALEKWYRLRAREYFEERLFACFEQFPDWFQDRHVMPDLTIRKMRRRWGSCSSSGEITLNLAIVKMPQTCIDYVIIHELCHLHAFHHGQEFYRLLAAIMPGWKEQENLIERIG